MDDLSISYIAGSEMEMMVAGGSVHHLLGREILGGNILCLSV